MQSIKKRENKYLKKESFCFSREALIFTNSLAPRHGRCAYRWWFTRDRNAVYKTDDLHEFYTRFDCSSDGDIDNTPTKDTIINIE